MPIWNPGQICQLTPTLRTRRNLAEPHADRSSVGPTLAVPFADSDQVITSSSSARFRRPPGARPYSATARTGDGVRGGERGDVVRCDQGLGLESSGSPVPGGATFPPRAEAGPGTRLTDGVDRLPFRLMSTPWARPQQGGDLSAAVDSRRNMVARSIGAGRPESSCDLVGDELSSGAGADRLPLCRGYESAEPH